MSLSEVMIKKSLKVSYTRKELEKNKFGSPFCCTNFRDTHKRGKEKEEISLSHHLMSSFGVTLISALHEAYGAYVTFSAFKILFVMNPSISSNFSNNNFNFVLLLCLKRIFFVFEHFFALRCFLRKSRKSSSLKKSSSASKEKTS